MTVQSGFSSQENSEKVARRSKTALRGSDLLFLMLAIVGSLHVMTMLGIETYRILKNGQGIEALDLQIADLKEKIATMDAINLNADDAFMEELARCQSYIFPGEQRYITELPEEAVASLACPSIY